MSRWDNLTSPKQPSEPKWNQVPVNGSFMCQVCDMYVDTAVYIPQEHVLTWKCADGHKSFIEKFSI